MRAFRNEITQLLHGLPSNPQVLWMTPKCIEQTFENVRELGEATDRSRNAEELITLSLARLESIRSTTQSISHRPRVFCMEWLDPIYCSGHWVPEMVEIAGGTDELGRPGADSVRISWESVLEWAPEILILMPCGFNLKKTLAQSSQLFAYPGWSNLPAAKDNRIYAVDASSYFARPGPRVVEGTELLAHLLHPDMFPWKGRTAAFRAVTLPCVASP